MLNDMNEIRNKISYFLKNSSDILILGIGNDIRGDDGLGPYIINQLIELKEEHSNNDYCDNLTQDNDVNNMETQNSDDNVNDINTGNGPLSNDVDTCESNALDNESEYHNSEDDDFGFKDFNLNNLHLINGGSVPENFTGLIKRIAPSHIIIIDATLMNKQEGKIEIINKEDISNISVSTHSMSLSYLIKYLEQEIDFEILFIGIQPEIMDLSFELSDCIKSSSDDLISVFKSLFF